jgi:hypothetical protein
MSMATNLADRSDKELEQGLAEGEFGDKKAIVAEELLRRRCSRGTNTRLYESPATLAEVSLSGFGQWERHYSGGENWT